jgi:hypothetical protein
MQFKQTLPAGSSLNNDCMITTDTGRFISWEGSNISPLSAFQTATGQELNGTSNTSCAAGTPGPTPTPSSTRTPTRTNTTGPSPTPTITPTPGLMSLVHVTSASGANGMSVTIPATTSNNLVVVCAANADGRSLSSVSDGSNTYSIADAGAGGGAGSGLAYAVQATAGITSLTINLSGSSSALRVDVAEFSGNLTSGVLGTHGGKSTTSASLDVPSLAVTTGNLVVACGGASGNRSWTPGSGFTTLSTSPINITSTFGFSEWQLNTTGSSTGAMSIDASAGWSDSASEFKAQ